MPKYVGLFSKDLINSRENHGCEYWKNGKMKYRGRFSNDSKNGPFGMSYGANGSLYYIGGYDDGKFSGKGICYWDSTEAEDNGQGIRAFGNFKSGLLHGNECAIFDKQGRLRYFGR